MANTVFKAENGLLVIGDSSLSGNLALSNTGVVTANIIAPVSNSSVLGNSSSRWVVSAVTGDFSSTVAIAGNVAVNTSVLVVTSNTTASRVGVGTATPDATLGVAGTANISGNIVAGALFNAVGNTTVGSNTLFVDTTGGFVRVGTADVTNTAAVLAVNGNTFISANLYVAGQSTVGGALRVTGDLIVNGNMSYTGTANADIIPNGNSFALGSPSNTSNRWIVYAVSGVVDNDFEVKGKLTLSKATTTHTISGNVNIDAGTLYVDATNNRIGINNTTPAQTLVVTGTANVSANSWLSNTVILTSNATVSQANIVGQMVVSGNVAVNTSALVVTSNTTAVRVGVATASPDATLTISGTANVSGNVNLANTLFVSGNTRIGNSTSFVLIKSTGALQLSKEIEIGNTSVYSNTQLISTGANTIIDAFPITEYNAAKFILNYRSTSNSQVFGATEILVVQNGTTAIATEYGTVFSANIAFSLDAGIVGANCNLYASANQGNLSVTTTRISML